MPNNFNLLKPGDRVVVLDAMFRPMAIYIVQEVKEKTLSLKNSDALYRRDNGKAAHPNKHGRQSLSLDKGDFLVVQRRVAQKRLSADYPLTQAGVEAARAAANYAERVLRSAGEWFDVDIPAEMTLAPGAAKALNAAADKIADKIIARKPRPMPNKE